LRILLSGYYGLGNLGDEAILAGLAGALRERGHAPLVLSGDPAATEAEHGLLARHRTRGLLGALASADVVVSGGGGLLQDKTSARSLSYYLWIVRLARWFGRPVAVYGQSFGPLSPAGRARVQRELRGVPLFLRDQQSLRLAADLGLDASLVGDAALLLERPRPQGGTRRGAEPARSPGGDPHAGAGPVVLVPRGGYDQYNDVLERLAPSLEAAGRSLAVVAFHPEEDRLPAQRVAAAASCAKTLTAATVADAVDLLAGASYVVSARLHGNILAAVAGVGFAGLSYDPKVAGFLEQASAPSFEAPVDEPALLAAALTAAPPDAVSLERLFAAAQAGVDSLLRVLR